MRNSFWLDCPDKGHGWPIHRLAAVDGRRRGHRLHEEILKARDESMGRAIEQANAMGANAIIGLDIETANLYQSIVMISATGTAVIIEPDVPAPP